MRRLFIALTMAVTSFAASAHTVTFHAMDDKGHSVVFGTRTTAQGKSSINLSNNGVSVNLAPSDAGEWVVANGRRVFVTHWHDETKSSDITDVKLVEVPDSQIAFIGIKLDGKADYYTIPLTVVDGFPE